MRPHLLAYLCATFVAASSHFAYAQSKEGAAVARDHIAKRIDPAAFTPRFFLRDEYRARQDGAYTNFLVPLYEFPISDKLALRFEVPIVSNDPNQPGASSETGIGDITTRLSWNVGGGEGYSFVVGGEFSFDTASDDSLGAGKNVISPIAFASIKVPQIKSVFFPFFQHYYTLSGDSSRPDVHYTMIKPILLTRLPNRFYAIVEPAISIDHARSDKVGATLELELGRFADSQTMLYARPGVGLFGDNLPAVYNWNFEVGLRYFIK